jgi:hypothetical protein
MMRKLCVKFVAGRWVRWVRQTRREWVVLPRELEWGFKALLVEGAFKLYNLNMLITTTILCML